MMVNDHFADLRAVPGSIDGRETVHLSIEPNSFDHMPLVSLEEAAKIVKRNAGDERNQLIGQDTRNIALNVNQNPLDH
jgi:hypothetical protein